MKVTKQSWEQWREKLLPIIQQTAERNDHSFAEFLDKALSSDRAFLFCSEDGFFVLMPVEERRRMVVEVSFAYCWADNGIMTYQEVIETLAREIGADALRLFTMVEKLIPLLTEQGYQKVSGSERVMCWMKELEE